MQRIVIKGGQALQGRVEVSGAKNAALPLLAATLLSDGVCELTNVPTLDDVHTIGKLLQQLGVRLDTPGVGKMRLDASSLTSWEAPYDLVKTMRASVLVLGPLLARCGQAYVSLPGGCAIGPRPIDQHLLGLQALGADIRLEHGYVSARATRLQGANIHLSIPTVTGTENLMMAAVLARGHTRLFPAACEPEVVCLAEALNCMGACVRGAGTDTIDIEGVEHLHPFDYAVIPDRIEAGTLAVAAAITGGEVEIAQCVPGHLQAVVQTLRKAHVDVEVDTTSLYVQRHKPLQATDFATAPYPGFATDMQAQMMALLALAEGTSTIQETVFENRFMHVAELKRMGAHLEIHGNQVRVSGQPLLSGAPVMATDLRASACLILAGLAAQGTTVVSRVYHLDRGYERLEEKLALLGAQIWRED